MLNSAFIHYRYRLSSKQSGAVLIVGLIMVLMITIIGLAAIRGSALQEFMAGNMRDRNLAFQAAEAGLRMGERVVRIDVESSNLPVFDGTVAGLWPDLNVPGQTPPSLWDAATWSAEKKSVLTSGVTSGTSSQPRYVVEKIIVSALSAAAADGSAVDLGSLDTIEPPEFYRITSRGVGGTTDTDVLVQSIYKR